NIRGDFGELWQDPLDHEAHGAVELDATPGGGADDGAEHAVQCGLRVAGIKLSSSVEAAGPGRDVQSAGGVSHRNDGRVGSADEPQRDGEVPVVDGLPGDVVPGLAFPPRPAALAHVDGVDRVAGLVEEAGHVVLEEVIRHPVDEK